MVNAQAMNLRLVVRKPGGQRQILPIHQEDAVVGRAHGSAIRIPSVEVSRQHCRIRQANGIVTVEDLDSFNGTYLNGRPISGPQLARPGDRLEIGPVTFIIEYELLEETLERIEGFGIEEDIEDVLPVEEEEEVLQAEELPLETFSADDDLPLLERDDELLEDDAQDVPNIFDFDEDRWEMPQGGLHNAWSEAEEQDEEAEKDEQ